jgi:hypothetical protein
VVRLAELGQPSLPAGQRAQGADAATSSSSSAVDLSSDPRWRKYTALVDKALASFDAVKEWADFIAFLARLLRTLQAQQPAFDEIPRKLLVAKRLAQCQAASISGHSTSTATSSKSSACVAPFVLSFGRSSVRGASSVAFAARQLTRARLLP